MPVGEHYQVDALLGGEFEGWGVTDPPSPPHNLRSPVPAAAATAAAAETAASYPWASAAAENPPSAVTAIQAAVRGHQSRADVELRTQWLEQLSERGKLTPQDLGQLPNNKQQVPDALLGTRNRQAAVASAKLRQAEEKKNAAKLAGKPKPKVPRQGIMGARAKSAGAGAGAGAARAVIQDPAWRKANKDFVRNLILEPCIEKACKLGEAMLAARARQAAFETRELQKAVCVASLFGTASVSGDAHSSLAVVEQDGLAVVCSRNEFLQLSMHTAPLPQLGLSPLIRQTPQQAAELPSTAKVHSTTVSLPLLLLPPPPASSRLLRLLLLLPRLLLPPPPASSASSPSTSSTSS